MIVRVLRLTIRPSRVAAFDVLFRRQVAVMRTLPGLSYVTFARRIQADGSEDAVLFEDWNDATSLYAWVGPDLTAPRLLPGVRELVDTLEVAHFEVVGEPVAAPATAPEADDDAATAGGEASGGGAG